MPRTPASFKATDLTRAVKAMRAAGYADVMVTIRRNGEIAVSPVFNAPAPEADEPRPKFRL